MLMRFAIPVLLITSLFATAPVVGQPSGPSGPSQTGSDPSEELIKAILIQQAAKTIAGNLEASKRESGEIDKLIRAISGISPGDIQKYGICGGPNSEVRKAFGSLCR